MNKILTVKKTGNNFYLVLILFISLFLRTVGLNWDQGHHLHPDERQITMVAENIKLPESRNISDIFSPNSSLNPKFFAYGSLPIYLLKFSGYVLSFINPNLMSYDKINLVGRFLSALFDTLTVLVIYLISKQFFSSNKKALTASLIYTLSVFPIQLSHFYAVDTLLTFFISLTLYRLIILYRHFSPKNSIIVGICFGLALATKVSAFVLFAPVFVSFVVDTIINLGKQIFEQKNNIYKKVLKFIFTLINPLFWLKSKIFNIKKVFFSLILIVLFSTLTFVICQPFTITDFPTFWRQINEQSAMTKNAFVFPYTLQYVGTLPYWYHLKNIFMWGLGPSLGILALSGLIISFLKLFQRADKSTKKNNYCVQFIVFSFLVVYFFVVGRFAVKFMRYCLPIYPILAIISVNSFDYLKKNIKIVFFFANLFWVISFLSIYLKPHTRVVATQWISDNVLPGSTILREHWDDGLPLGYHDEFTLDELSLYDSDNNPDKWPKINQQLRQSDYIVIASNRLYTPLQKLTNCSQLPRHQCYLKTAKYYQDLFSGNLNYVKVAEFSSYPSLLGVTINDQSADESFTVYDHPKIMIYKKNDKNP